MRVPTNNNRIQILAIAALATCAVALTWSASALARPIDDPALPAGVASSDPAQPTPYSGPHPGLSDFGVKALSRWSVSLHRYSACAREPARADSRQPAVDER